MCLVPLRQPFGSVPLLEQPQAPEGEVVYLPAIEHPNIDQEGGKVRLKKAGIEGGGEELGVVGYLLPLRARCRFEAGSTLRGKVSTRVGGNRVK